MSQQKMPKQKPEERVKNFFEVALGFSKEQALLEAKRCLQCKKPFCVEGCPVQINIPAFIKLIAEGKFEEAIKKIKEKNNLPAVCGRVCPQETQCEAVCILNKKKMAINIGSLERFAADHETTTRKITGSNKATKSDKVAVVGSGPAGLTAAADLAKLEYNVTMFESLHLPGGVLMYGIPEFRLPKKIVLQEVEYIKSLGVDFRPNVLIGKTYTIDELFKQGFKAIFVAVGAGLPQFMRIPGENANRVYSANEFLTRMNLMKAYKFPEYATPINIGEKIAVVGAGNVAFDCARVAMRLGKDVTLVYRRSEQEMPARAEEIENAREEGLKFKLLTQPTEILVDDKGFVNGMKCLQMQLGEPDASGRRRPIPIKNSEFILDVDTVIVAIGQNPNPLLYKSTPKLKVNEEGTIWVDENLMTSIPGVFAGGDIITGADTVISAMGAGKKAAAAIDNYLKKVK
ncbi:MAG: NADPH-dependent glutamate synthase [Candidatus Omnitrophica bacterium]|nr:NADPH-dependent glutamate synthase [Candidatus Omnitrophota bacterium]HOX55072.1 NADPH-dependent glutamate synthase [Candidatus Omnitrophota bacterium]